MFPSSLEWTSSRRVKLYEGSNSKVDRSTLDSGIYFVSHGARLAIRANDPRVLDRLHQHLPPGWQPTSSPIVDTVYSIIVSSDGLTFDDRRFQLYVDSTPLARTTNLDDLCEAIEADLHFRVALHARQLIFGVFSFPSG